MQMKLLSGIVVAVLAVTMSALVAQAGAPSDPGVDGDERWDDRFGIPGILNDVNAVAVAANGDVFVGGYFFEAGGVPANNIARWDGRRWHALGAGVDGEVRQIAVSGANVYVVGSFSTAGAVNARQIARWDGNQWSAVGTGSGPANEFGSSADIYAIAANGNTVYVGGDFDQMDGVPALQIARWNGSQWSAVGEGVGDLNFDETALGTDGVVYALVAEGSDVYVGGDFSHAASAGGPISVNNIARWNGSTWSALGAGVAAETEFDFAAVYALLKTGSLVYAGGEFKAAGGQPANHIARWNGSSWSPLSTGIAPDSFVYKPVRALQMVGSSLYVGGSFLGAGGQASANLAVWNGSAWSVVSKAPDGAMNALAAAPTGDLFAAGRFDRVGDLFVSHVARLNAGEWRALGEGVLNYASYLAGADVRAVAVDAGGRVFIGGRFEFAGGVAAKNLAMWDGAAWHNIGNVDDTVEALVVGGDYLYLGGSFSQAGTTAAQRVARWHLQNRTWSALGSGINGPVYTLAYGNDVLVAGGQFTGAGGVSAYDVAWWNGAQWRAFGDTFRIYERGSGGGEYPTSVHGLAVQGDTVIIGGEFQTIQSLTGSCDVGDLCLVNNVVGWVRSTDTWFKLGPHTPTQEPGVTVDGRSGFNIRAEAVTIHGDNVYIGGAFNLAGSTPAANVARWNSTDNRWDALDAGAGGFFDTAVHTLAVVGNSVVMGGHFTTAGDAIANFVALYNPGTNSWSPLGSGLVGPAVQYTDVNAVAAAGNSVYFVGDFTLAGGQSSNGVARYDMSPPPMPYSIFLPQQMR